MAQVSHALSSLPGASPKHAVVRNDTIELLRVVAVCGVIWFHTETTPFKPFGFAGLVYFLVVSVVFQKLSAERNIGCDYFKKRALRLFVPWGGWFVIYGLLNVVRGKQVFPYSSGPVSDLLAGPWIGLWYLPFSFAVFCVVYGLVMTLRRLDHSIQFLVWLSLSVVLLLATTSLRASHSWSTPWAQWLHAAPSIPIGLAIACALQASPKSMSKIILAQATLLITCALIYPADHGMGISYGLGSLLATLGFTLAARFPIGLSQAGGLCLGVYLVHGAVASGFRLLPFITKNYLAWFLATTIVSFVVVIVMRKIPLVKRIV